MRGGGCLYQLVLFCFLVNVRFFPLHPRSNLFALAANHIARDSRAEPPLHALCFETWGVFVHEDMVWGGGMIWGGGMGYGEGEFRYGSGSLKTVRGWR